MKRNTAALLLLTIAVPLLAQKTPSDSIKVLFDSLRILKTNVDGLQKTSETITTIMTYIGIPLAGLSAIAIIKLLFFQLPKTATEAIKTKAEGMIADNKKQYSKFRVLILSNSSGKQSWLNEILTNEGFDNAKLIYDTIQSYQNYNSSNLDLIFFNNKEDTMPDTEIEKVLNHFQSQTKYFYLSSDVRTAHYGRIGMAANSENALKANLLKHLT